MEFLFNLEFDIFLDCGGELMRKVGAPKIGSVELTGSGDHFYRQQKLTFPVISIDRSNTKQLETVFGIGDGTISGIKKLTELKDISQKNFLLFGFGKIGRGIGFYCKKNNVAITVVDSSVTARNSASNFGISSIAPGDITTIKSALKKADIVITATGKSGIFDTYPKTWFTNKILVNLGVLDEFGSQFSDTEVLNQKKPINFVMEDPTPIQYIDPELYAHAIAITEILHHKLATSVHDLPSHIDQQIIDRWCQYHQFDKKEINKWFIRHTISKL